MAAVIYDDDYLPGRWRAMSKLMKQPFFGELHPDVVRPRWVWTHRYWVVGTLLEVLQVHAQASREYTDLIDRAEERWQEKQCQRCRPCGSFMTDGMWRIM